MNIVFTWISSGVLLHMSFVSVPHCYAYELCLSPWPECARPVVNDFKISIPCQKGCAEDKLVFSCLAILFKSYEHFNQWLKANTPIYPFMPNGIFLPLSIGQIYFDFKGCWVIRFGSIFKRFSFVFYGNGYCL